MDERHVALGCIGESVTAVTELDYPRDENPTHKRLGEYILEAIEIMKETHDDCNTVETKFNLPEKGLSVTLTITRDEKNEA